MKNGQLQLVNQLNDYANRGDSLESYSLIEFYQNTYEGKKLKENTADDIIVRASKRSNYKSRENNSKCRIVRRKGHETMVELIGSWIPRQDDEETYPMYCGMMLALLAPWRDLAKLRGQSAFFREEYDKFLKVATPKQLSFVKNSQYFHEASDSAFKRGQHKWYRNEPETDAPINREDGEYSSEDAQEVERASKQLQIIGTIGLVALAYGTLVRNGICHVGSTVYKGSFDILSGTSTSS